jgi:DnaJ family protein C protein 7
LNNREEALYANRALCYKGLNKIKNALYDLNKAVELSPKNTKYLKRLALLHLSIGNFGNAENLIQKCMNLEPRDTTHSADFNRVKEHINNYESLIEFKGKEDWKRCEELCDKLNKEITDFTALKVIYVETLLENVKIQEALYFIVNKLTPEEKSSEEFEYLTCLALYYDGKYDKARSVLSILLQKIKDNEKLNSLWKILKEIESQKEKANEIFKAGKYQEAIESYNKLLELDPKNKSFNSTIYANKALCYQKLNNMMEALRDINKSISLNEKYMKAYVRRGNIYMALKMYDEARYDYQKVKESEPDNKEVVKLLEEAKKEEKKAKKRDYYQILGVGKEASQDEIRRAYKKLALKWHPDRNNTSEEQKKMAEKTFRDINDAYSVLSDTQKKQQFDMGSDPLNPEEASGMDGSGMNFGGGNAEDIFKMFFGGGGMGGMGGGSNGKI